MAQPAPAGRGSLIYLMSIDSTFNVLPLIVPLMETLMAPAFLPLDCSAVITLLLLSPSRR